MNIKIKTAILGIFLVSSISLQAEDLTLKDFIGGVEKNSKDLKQAELDRKLAMAQRSLAGSALRPVISGSAGYTRNLIERTQNVAVGVNLPDNYTSGFQALTYQEYPANFDNEMTLQVGLQQTIFDAKAFTALEASSKYTELTDTTYDITRDSIITAAKKIYFQAQLLARVYELRKDSEANAYENFLKMQDKYDIREIAELELLQAKVNWQSSISETAISLRNLKLIYSNMKQLAGIEPATDIVLTDSVTEIPELPETMDFDEILGKRSDYRVLKQALSMQELNIKSMKSAFYPVVTATAGAAFNYMTDNELDPTDVQAVQLGVNISLPIYYGGSRFIQLDQAKLERDEAALDIIKKQDDISNQMIEIGLILEEAKIRISSAELTLETAKKAYDITDLSLKNGLATQLDMKDAQLSLDGAQISYHSALFDYLSAYFDYQNATGSGSSVEF